MVVVVVAHDFFKVIHRKNIAQYH